MSAPQIPRRRALGPAIVLLALAIAAPAGAQRATLGLGRQLGDPARAPATEVEPAADAAGERPWPGPQIQVSYGYSKLADGYGGGDTHAAALEVFLQWPIPELRTSALVSAGGRDYSLAGEDLLFRAAIAVGAQLPAIIDPLVPHIALVVTTGAVLGERFDTFVAYGFGGGGVELGAALRIFRNLHAALTLSYLRLEMNGAALDVFELRLALGL